MQDPLRHTVTMNTTADAATGRHIRLKLQLLNSLLRLLPLLAKFVFTLYMGRFFSWEDIGVYGLVFGAVVILTTTLGQRLDFILARDIAAIAPETALVKIRDAVIFYGMNYLVLAVMIFAMIAMHVSEISPQIMIYILVLSVLENLGALLNTCMNSLNQQLIANAIFLVRSGIWVLPAMILGMLNPVFRSPDTVLACWSAGAFVSLLITFWYWRGLPWHAALLLPVDWQWIRQGVKKSIPFWVGMTGLIGGSFSDRFVVEHFLTPKYVGILTFYTSFTNAMLTLMQSGVIVFAYPRLIALYRDSDIRAFHKEVWHTTGQMTFGATVIALILAIAVPMLGPLLGRPELVEQEGTLWLLLLGTWLRVNAEVFLYVMFARHQDRPLWLGNLLFIIPALGGSILLVPLVGFSGIGYCSILPCFFLLLWRLWYVRDLLPMKTA